MQPVEAASRSLAMLSFEGPLVRYLLKRHQGTKHSIGTKLSTFNIHYSPLLSLLQSSPVAGSIVFHLLYIIPNTCVYLSFFDSLPSTLSIFDIHFVRTMYTQQILLAVLAALSVSALPLNINLGAYSPALVVGDGEISFGGNPERASELLQTLASGAATGATGQPAAAARPAVAAVQPAAAVAEAPRPVAAAPLAPTTEGITSPIVTPAAPIAAAQQIPGINTNAPAAIITEDSPTSKPTEFISHAITGTKYPNMVKRSIELERRAVRPDARVNVAKEKIRRDLAGFREALSFARDAQKNQPKIELGFGIVQNAGIDVPVASAANGELPPGGVAALEKREAEAGAKPEKLGMTLIAISEI